MKQRIFTLVMMLALVVMAGGAFAQSTISAPYVGSTYTYSVSGVTGTGYGIYVTATSVTDGSTASANQVLSSSVTIASNTGTGTYSNSTITANITWNVAGTYRIWAVVTNSTSCTNYLYKDITVIDQTVEYLVIALGEDSGNTDATHYAATTLTGECFQKTGATYADGSETMGTTIVYFKVVRTASANDQWSFTATFSGTATINTIAWGTTTSTISTSITSGATITVPTGSNTAYFGVTVADATAAKTVILTASAYDENSTTVSQTVTTDDYATIQIEGLPTVGDFNF